MPINHTRSIMFWRRHKPHLLAAAAARGTHVECPLCHGAHVLHVTGLEGEAASELEIDCACYALQYEATLALLAYSLDQASASPLPTFAELAHRTDCAALEPAIDDLYDLTQWPDHHPWVVLSGLPGNGKTHLALATRALLGGLAAYVEVSALSERLFVELKTQHFAELIEDLVAVPVLILDDLGTEHAGAELIATALSNILTRRFARALDYPTVLTTNLQEDQLASRYPRVFDRLTDKVLIHLHTFACTSYRPLKGGGEPAPERARYGYSPREAP